MIDVETGDELTCVNRRSGRVACWGRWSYYEYPYAMSRLTASDGVTEMTEIEGAVEDICVSSMACMITDRKEVWCAGSNQYGQLGDMTRIPRRHARRVEGLPPVERMLCGPDSVCAFDAEDRAWCWGRLYPEEIGKPELRDHGFLRVLPHPVEPPAEVPDIVEVLKAYRTRP